MMRMVFSDSAETAALTDALRAAVIGQPNGAFRAMIQGGTVSEDLIERIRACITEHPRLVTMNASQVTAAMWTIDPESARLLDSAAGQRWMAVVAAKVTAAQAGKILGTLFGGKP